MLPTIEEYIDSFRETTDYFKTLKLQTVPSKFDANEPYFIAGGFACVFKVKQDNQFWAFKCFLQEDKHRNERLKILSEFLQQRTENYFIKTHYYTDELWVCSQLAGDAEYPTLAMPWIEGQTLGEYIHQAAKKGYTEKIKVIYDEFLRLAHFLLTNEFAHGDLKHDNILVTQDQNLILIDYDGMYLPELAHISSQELGGHAYQHPKRTAQDWGKHIDDFSILVILLSLRAFIVLPSLIKNHHSNDLLLTDNDIKNPMQSPLLQTLWQQKDEQLKQLFGILFGSLTQNNLRVLEIGAFVERNKPHEFFHWKWWNGLEQKWKRSLRERVKGNENEVIFFEKIMNLNVLYSYDKITSLPNWIGNLTNLTKLNLSYHHITSLPKSIGNLINLTSLNLNANQLTELPSWIGNLTNLTELSLSCNHLTSLPKSIGSLTKLTKLDVSGNRLTELPKNIGNLTKLTKLNVSGNRLTELPKSIEDLVNLTDSDLGSVSYSGNKFVELPENIGNLINLTKLRAWQVHLTRLPESIGNLTNLTDLNLEFNQLEELPESIGNLVNLKTLHLEINPLSGQDKSKIEGLLPNCEISF